MLKALPLTLPQRATYEGVGRCIYCVPTHARTTALTREHIVADKLGGGLILPKASCPVCQKAINREIETPVLTFMWLHARTLLGLPTSHRRDTLPIATWRNAASSSADDWPTFTEASDFQWEERPVDQFPLLAAFPRFAPPSLLSGDPPSQDFRLLGIEAYADGVTNFAGDDGRNAGLFLPIQADLICRIAAKIAHGAAVAELGIQAFQPLLPDIIMGRSPFISRLVGHSPQRGRKRAHLHEINLEVRRGLIVANVQLFAKLGLRPFQVVVGVPSPEIAKRHMSCMWSASGWAHVSAQPLQQPG